MQDVRNTVVKLALETQELLDLLNAGRRDQAHKLAERIADRAAAVADELSPEYARPGH